MEREFRDVTARQFLLDLAQGNASEELISKEYELADATLKNAMAADTSLDAVILAATIKGEIMVSRGQIVVPDGCVSLKCAKFGYILRLHHGRNELTRAMLSKAGAEVFACCDTSCRFNPDFAVMHSPDPVTIADEVRDKHYVSTHGG